MKLRVFTVFDAKALAYLPPFFMGEIGAAVRAFKECANDGTHMFGKHPEDFTLFCLGVWDDATAVFEPLPAHLPCGKALEYVDRPVVPGQLSLVDRERSSGESSS